MEQGRSDGVRFAVWAPNARRVSVVGTFNNWDGRRHAMRYCAMAPASGKSSSRNCSVGDLYKFEIVGPEGNLLPPKADPYARAAQLRPETASIVAAPLRESQLLPAERVAANRRDAAISIYEVHVASWRKPEGRFPSWDELAAEPARLCVQTWASRIWS